MKFRSFSAQVAVATFLMPDRMTSPTASAGSRYHCAAKTSTETGPEKLSRTPPGTSTSFLDRSSSALCQRLALIERRLVVSFTAAGFGPSIFCWASGGSGVGSRWYCTA